eukprot:scaffold14777_cov118-Isochrysis_galbana.AAC.2
MSSDERSTLLGISSVPRLSPSCIVALPSPSLESESPLAPLSSRGFLALSAPFLGSDLTTGPLGGPEAATSPFFTSLFHCSCSLCAVRPCSASRSVAKCISEKRTSR